MRFGIGQPVRRKEDVRFLTGLARYVADIDLVRQAHAVFVFSPHAHAQIRGIDKTAAERMPGVFAVLTGEDWAADGLGTLDPEVMAEDMGGPKGYRTKRPPLAIDRVRYVGERVAIVIAASGPRRGRGPHRRAASPRGRRQQHLFHDAHGRCRRGRGRVRQGAPHRQTLALQQPAHRRHDGAARLHWRV